MTSLPRSQEEAEPRPERPADKYARELPATALPFLIARTSSSHLPVYEEVKAGGSKHITRIRKISGDVERLASAVRLALGLPEHITDVKGKKKNTVSINWTTNHVVVRGWRGAEVKKWAELSGF